MNYLKILEDMAVDNVRELNQQDKMIDMMAYALTHESIPQEEYCICADISCEIVGGNRECKECMKEYIKKKVDETNE